MLFKACKKTAVKGGPGRICTTQTGWAYNIEEMPDPVFADKVLGDGVCIVPRGKQVCSPVCGTVGNVSEAGHAFSIRGDDGVEVMIHIGVDTIKMPSGTFRASVRAGQAVQQGDILCHADIKAIKKAGYATHTAILLVNTKEFEIVERQLGRTKRRKSIVFTYRKL